MNCSVHKERTLSFSQTLEGKVVKALLSTVNQLIYTATDMHGRLLVLETFPTNASVPPRVNALASMKSTWTPSTLKNMRSLVVRQVQNL